MVTTEHDYAIEERAKGMALDMYTLLATTNKAPGVTILFRYQEQIAKILDQIELGK